MVERLDEWRFEKLSRAHDRATFSSNVAALDTFLKNSARQNADVGVSATIVAVRPGATAVSGFFTVRMGEVAFDLLPELARKKLPRYPIPVVHLARLAVDVRERGKGLGELLLMECFARALRANVEVSALAIEVVAKDEAAVRFYTRYGFTGLLDDHHHMFLSMKAVEEAFARR
jgi:GNAT superfamily N-acetyltransferase